VPAADWLESPAVSYSHEVMLPLPPDEALAHALSTPMAPDRLVAALLRLRGFDPEGSIEAFGSTPPFVELRRTPTEWVAGVGAGVWRPGGGHGPFLRDAEEWRGWEPPGTIRAVVTLIARGDEREGWTRLVSETAAKPSDDKAARAFRLYWLAVGPFSKLIRRRWLRAMAARASTAAAR
jgi:hypothetical protein